MKLVLPEIRGLLRAEFDRLFARRFFRVMVVLLVAAFGITLFTTIASTHQPNDAERARATRQAAERRADLSWIYRQCQLAQEPGAPSELKLQFPRSESCEMYDPERIRDENFLTGVFTFTNTIRDLVLFLTAFLCLFGFLVGASFVGAEMSSGGMTNLLLWRPRRLAILSAKLGALLLTVTALSVLATLLYVGSFWALAEASGNPGDQTGEFWGDLTVLCVRGIALALVVTGLAFAVATVGRHTSAAIGLLAGYAVVWEVGARLVLELGGADRPAVWFLSSYAAAWMNGHLTMYDDEVDYTITWWHAGLVFAAALAAVVGGTFAHFRRRDLT